MTEWQSIATAPKDGTRILSCWADGGEHTIIEWFEYSGAVFEAGYEGSWFQRVSGLGSDGGYEDAAFSHWMHLPAPPAAPPHAPQLRDSTSGGAA